MTPNQLLTRARSAAGKKVVYKLGAGGMNPAKAMPTDAQNRCDCSGFICWALGISRQTTHPLYVNFNGGWINTDAIVHDAVQETGFFRKAQIVVPGVVLVYPHGAVHSVGHCGIVTQVSPTGAPLKVIHCSSGNSKLGDAIQETAPTVFNTPDAIAVWYEGLTQPVKKKRAKFG